MPSEHVQDNENTKQELDGVRASRSTPLNQRWKPQERIVTRSRSSHPIGRLKLPDDCWVLERPSSQVIEEEKEKRLQELIEVKQARLDQAEILELDRPSSRLEVQARNETLKELEHVKHMRQEVPNEDEFSVEGMGSAFQHQHNDIEEKTVRFTESKEIPKICKDNPTSKVLPTNSSVTMKIKPNEEEPKSKFQQMNNITEKKERAR